MEEREFSVAYFLKYAWRYLLVIVLCAAIGLGAGVVLVVEKAVMPNVEKYTATIRFNAVEYAALQSPNAEMSEGEFSLYTRQLTQVVETAGSKEVAAAAYTAVADLLYSGKSTADKSEAFYKDFLVKPTTDALVVSFTYDIQSEAERDAVKIAIATFTDRARQNVMEKHPEFKDEAYANVISVSSVVRDFQLDESHLAANHAPSLLTYAALGAIVGLILGGGGLFVWYLLDPRVKTVTDILTEEKCCVIDPDKEDSVTNFAALCKATNAKRVLLFAPVADDLLAQWADGLCATLTATGAKVKKVSFAAADPTWFNYFDGECTKEELEIYLCNGTESGVASFISANADAAAVFANHKAVKAKGLAQAVESVNGCKYLATLLHSTGRAYLD